MNSNIFDSIDVEKNVNERLGEYFSLLFGNVDISNEMLQKFKRTNENINSWMDLTVKNYEEIKERAGLKNDHLLAYIIIIQSWIKYPCSDVEAILAIRAVYELLSITNYNGELDTPDNIGLESNICYFLEDLNKEN